MTITKMRLTKDPKADVEVSARESGRNHVQVIPKVPDLFVPYDSCETAYDFPLIEQIYSVKGPAYLIDEILRDESPDYVQSELKWGLLAYVESAGFVGKRILDFGCGSGSSSSIMARMFPKASVTGIELDEELLTIARARAAFYGFDNVSFLASPAPDKLPSGLGKFDFVLLSAVYEHLLPAERRQLMPMLWDALAPGGILFLNGTPNRRFPLETHTTGLPLINYLPDGLAGALARRFSRRNLQNRSWEELLRAGIRGGTIREIVTNLSPSARDIRVLDPGHLNVRDRIDIWYALTTSGLSRARSPAALAAKKTYRTLSKLIASVAGVEFLPNLSLAFEKRK